MSKTGLIDSIYTALQILGSMQATELHILLTLAGGQAYKLMKGLAFLKKPDALSVTEIRDLIVKHTTPHIFEVAERSKFNSLTRRAD